METSQLINEVLVELFFSFSEALLNFLIPLIPNKSLLTPDVLS